MHIYIPIFTKKQKEKLIWLQIKTKSTKENAVFLNIIVIYVEKVYPDIYISLL